MRWFVTLCSHNLKASPICSFGISFGQSLSKRLIYEQPTRRIMRSIVLITQWMVPTECAQTKKTRKLFDLYFLVILKRKNLMFFVGGSERNKLRVYIEGDVVLSWVRSGENDWMCSYVSAYYSKTLKKLIWSTQVLCPLSFSSAQLRFSVCRFEQYFFVSSKL